MRRAPIVITSTIAGLGAVLAFHPHSQAPLAAIAHAPAATPAPAPRARPAPHRPHTVATATVDGTAEPNRYGTVQVRVRARAGRIVSVTPLQLPQGDARSAQISTTAAPTLARQALAAQSAGIDGVSGASYTSAGYAQSLQSALDQLPAAA